MSLSKISSSNGWWILKKQVAGIAMGLIKEGDKFTNLNRYFRR